MIKTKKKWLAIFAIILIMTGLSTLEKDNLLRILARQGEEISKIKAQLNGAPINAVRIKDASITSAKIGDIDASKIKTGVLTLQDGAGNPRLRVLDAGGDEIVSLDLGGMQIKDAAGNLLVTLDPNGLVVNGGNILVKNDDGDTVFDVKGLVSINNFLFNRQTIGTVTVINPSSLTTISGSSQTITLDRDTNVLLMVSMEAFISGLVEVGQVFMYVDGSPSTSQFINIKSDGHGQHQSITLMDIQLLSSGSHTFELKCIQSGSDNLSFYSVSKIWITLGK